jgi:predicted aspartyl protease
METTLMGKVLVTARIENLEDLFDAEKGLISSEAVRTVETHDALVDTGGTGLLLPRSMITALGLRPLRVRQSRGLGGTVPMPMYRAVRLTIQGRDCAIDVGEIGDEFPVLIGQVPLELLDWVVDPKGQRLIGNPEHGGEHVMEVFRQAVCSQEVLPKPPETAEKWNRSRVLAEPVKPFEVNPPGPPVGHSTRGGTAASSRPGGDEYGG